MTKKYHKSSDLTRALIYFGLFVPTIAFAQLNFGGNFSALIGSVLSIISILIPILFALAFLVFFWGLSKFILHSGNEADVTKGKNYMLWGILALFLLVSSLAIVNFLRGELGFPTNVGYLLPE